MSAMQLVSLLSVAYVCTQISSSSGQSALFIQMRHLDNAWEHYFVGQHNAFRRNASTLFNAANMRKVRWSTRLARSAQRHARRCTFAHSRSSQRAGAGENIWVGSDMARMSGAVEMWYVEVFDPACRCDHTFSKCCGHYTQIVWSDTTEIGCGLAECTDIEWQRGRGYRLSLICHYSPAGNVIHNRRGKLPAFSSSPAGPCSACATTVSTGNRRRLAPCFRWDRCDDRLCSCDLLNHQ